MKNQGTNSKVIYNYHIELCLILIRKNNGKEQTNNVKKREDNEIYYDKSISTDNTYHLVPITFPHTRVLMQNCSGMDMCPKLCGGLGPG